MLQQLPFLHYSIPPSHINVPIDAPGSEDLASLAAPPQYIAQHPLVITDELVLQQPLAAPTMHPNLVSTLKSIIAPGSPSHHVSSGPDPTSNPPLPVINDILELVCNQTLRASASKQAPNSFSGLYSCSSFHSPQAAAAAAVVPIDVIQNRRPFRCGFAGCDKTFRNPQTLKMHHKAHYGGSDDRQTHPAATFPPPTYKAGHNKKIPSRCPVCRQTFVGLYELRRHFGRKHSEGEKTHGCRKCDKKFYIEVDLRDHEKLCGEPLRCKCGMKFAFKCNLVSHKRTRPECQDSEDFKGIVQAARKPHRPGDSRSCLSKANQRLKLCQNLKQQEQQISCASSNLASPGQSAQPVEWHAKVQCQDPWLQILPWVISQDNLDKRIIDVNP